MLIRSAPAGDTTGAAVVLLMAVTGGASVVDVGRPSVPLSLTGPAAAVEG